MYLRLTLIQRLMVHQLADQFRNRPIALVQQLQIILNACLRQIEIQIVKVFHYTVDETHSQIPAFPAQGQLLRRADQSTSYRVFLDFLNNYSVQTGKQPA